MAEAQREDGHYCAICGNDAISHAPRIERFGEAFCSEEHAERFVKEVRATRVQAAAVVVQEPEGRRPEVGAPKQQAWRRYLKLGACCGVPLLALVLLAGGGGALLGAAGALFPFLLALACPLGMYFMMRGMSKVGDEENPRDKGKQE